MTVWCVIEGVLCGKRVLCARNIEMTNLDILQDPCEKE